MKWEDAHPERLQKDLPTIVVRRRAGLVRQSGDRAAELHMGADSGEVFDH